MAGGRHTQPLFDLVRRRGVVNTSPERRTTMNPGVGWRPGMASPPAETPTAAPSPHAPSAVNRGGAAEAGGAPPAAVQNATTPAREVSSEELGQPSSWLGTILGNSTVRVPVNTVYYAIAAAGILTLFVLVAWYRNSSGESANRNDNARQQPLVVEPGETPLSGKPESNGTSPDLSGTKGPGGSESSRLAKPVATSKSSASSPSSVAVKSTESSKFGVPPRGAMGITARGWLAADPREPGLNYLKLGEFFQTESEDAVVFLAENGAEAFALAIDPTRLGVNNSDPTKSTFKLYAARGITTDEYSKKMTAKTNTEATVARLGARWQKERKGSSNFGKPGWEKFK